MNSREWEDVIRAAYFMYEDRNERERLRAVAEEVAYRVGHFDDFYGPDESRAKLFRAALRGDGLTKQRRST